MAFNVTSQAAKLIKAVGSFTEIAVGMVTMSSGTGTLDFGSALRSVDGAVGMVQGATGVGETVIATDITGTVVTLETVDESGSAAGTSVVMVMAWGVARAS